MDDVWGVEMTRELAVKIRELRVADESLTWRGVAGNISAEFGLSCGTNQLFGRDLCNAAARLLGEDPDKEPWN